VAWLPYFEIAGIAGANPSGEIVRGIGAQDNTRIDAAEDALLTWFDEVVAWEASLEAQITAAYNLYAAGEEVPEIEYDAFPTIGGLPDIIRGLPPAIRVALWLVLWIGPEVIAPIVRRIVEEIIRRRQGPGYSDPWLRLFRKFAFLREDDPDLGFEDLTSLLLLDADKPIEILNSLGSRDVFLDTQVIEDE
jgi:hypothetical protein